MCGRFSTKIEDVMEEEYELQDSPPAFESYNIAPGTDVPVVRLNRDAKRELLFMRWGLVPYWAKEAKIGYKMINARSETVREKPAFRKPFERMRCLIPATGFYEWQRSPAGKQPYYIHAASSSRMAFAGLWDGWQDPQGTRLRTCSIVTTEANDVMAPIHHRMPVILEPETFETWLQGVPDDADALMQLRPSERLEVYPVSTLVNKPENDDARCIERVDLHTGEVMTQQLLF